MVKNLKVSIFTPTHNDKYLYELYDSIKEQNFYEWVIITNNGVKLNTNILNDSRIKIFNYEHNFVGALKNYACSKCEGDILLEVDHDDLLTSDAVKEVINAFQDDNIGFVYSNDAYFKDNFDPVDKWQGWNYRDYTYKGHTLYETIQPSLTAHSISKIWTAPDHLRAWRKSTYIQSGGHAEDMRVLDDQDLMARTYIVSKCKHIDKCLYLYRVTGENTWIKHNKEIQDNVLRIYNKYILDLAIKWSELNNLKMLDFGGAFNGHEKLECVDINTNGVDLNEPFPWEDNSVGLIRANDILEHLDPKKKIDFIKEVYRVLAPNGMILACTPNALSQGGYQDPTHISYYVKNSFKYYTEKRYAQYIGTPVKFQAMYLEETKENEDNVSWIMAHLLALKEQENIAGPILI